MMVPINDLDRFPVAAKSRAHLKRKAYRELNKRVGKCRLTEEEARVK